MSEPLQTVVAVVVLLTTLAGAVGAVSATALPIDDEVGGPVTDGSFGTDVGFAADAGSPADGSLAQLAGDRAVGSGETYWSGARLQFDADRVIPDGAGENERTFELWRVTADGRLNQQVRSFTVAEDGTHELRTGGLSGRHAIRYGQRTVYVHDGVGYLESPPDGSDVTVDSSAFEFQRQTLDASWSDPEVYPGQRTTLTLTSNRDDYAVAVSGEGLTYGNLTELLPESAYAEDHDARSEEDVLIVDAGTETGFRLDTAVLEPGQQSLRFDAVDTDASATARLTVNNPGDDGRFESVERREDVGDVIEADVSCTHCFLVVGAPDQGMLDVVELRDSNGDDRVELRINTRYAGMHRSASGYPSGVDAYTSPHDSVNRYSSDAFLESVEEELNYNVVTLSDLRDQQGLESRGLRRPVEPGSLDLTVTDSDFLIDRSSYGSGPPHGGQLVIRDETDVRTVTLDPRRLDGAQTMAAPGGPRLPDDVDELRETTGPRESVALGDHLVFRFDVSGVFGYIESAGASVETVGNNRDEGVRLTLEELSGGGNPTTLPLGQTALEMYPDPSSDGLYVAVQTGGTSRTNLGEGRYRATLTLTGVDGKHRAYSTADAYTGYPYLSPGESESASGTVRLEPPTASIESPEEGAEPHLNPDGELVVTGTTSLAPGGTLQMRATATEYAWETTGRATVNETGHWTGSLALADAPGDEFTVAVSREGEHLDERTYTVRPPLEGGSDGGSSDGGGSGDGGGPLGGDGDGILSAIPGLSTLASLAVPIGAGVGVLVVVWAAWKLVIRRILI